MDTPTAGNRPVSAFSLFKPSQAAVTRNITPFAILYILPIVGTISKIAERSKNTQTVKLLSTGNVFGGASGLSSAGLVGAGVGISVLFIVASVLVQTMTTALQLQSAQGKTVSLSQVWEKVNGKILRLFGQGIVSGVLTILGLLLLIVPGLIVIRRLFLAPYLLIDKDLTIGEAMKRSAEMSKPYSGAIWGVIGVTVLISFFQVIPILGPIIALVLGLLYSVAPALRYEEIKKLSGSHSKAS